MDGPCLLTLLSSAPFFFSFPSIIKSHYVQKWLFLPFPCDCNSSSTHSHSPAAHLTVPPPSLRLYKETLKRGNYVWLSTSSTMSRKCFLKRWLLDLCHAAPTASSFRRLLYRTISVAVLYERVSQPILAHLTELLFEENMKLLVKTEPIIWTPIWTFLFLNKWTNSDIITMLA